MGGHSRGLNRASNRSEYLSYVEGRPSRVPMKRNMGKIGREKERQEEQRKENDKKRTIKQVRIIKVHTTHPHRVVVGCRALGGRKKRTRRNASESSHDVYSRK